MTFVNYPNWLKLLKSSLTWIITVALLPVCLSPLPPWVYSLCSSQGELFKGFIKSFTPSLKYTICCVKNPKYCCVQMSPSQGLPQSHQMKVALYYPSPPSSLNSTFLFSCLLHVFIIPYWNISYKTARTLFCSLLYS